MSDSLPGLPEKLLQFDGKGDGSGQGRSVLLLSSCLVNVCVYIHEYLQALVTQFPILQLNVDLQMFGNVTSGLAGALDLGSFRYASK